ncbi:MAG: hypothetical protein WA001_04285 [Patescibacteria group bacterium]
MTIEGSDSDMTTPLYAVDFDRINRICKVLQYEVTPENVIQRRDGGTIKAVGRRTPQGPKIEDSPVEPLGKWVHSKRSSVYWTEQEAIAISMAEGVQLGCPGDSFYVGFGPPPKPKSDRPQGLPQAEGSAHHGE